MEDPSLYLILIPVTLLLSAFFSGMEIAFISANKLKIEVDSKAGNFLAKMIGFFVKRPSKYIGTMLVGNNIALVVYGILMGSLLDPKIAEYISSNALTLFLSTIISTLIILVTAEFLPKVIFRINPNATLSFFAIPAWIFFIVLYIPVFLIIGISEIILKYVFKVDLSNEELNFGKIDLDHFIEESYSNIEGDQMENEVHIFRNALDFFAEVKARDCMIPRTEIVAIEVNSSIEELTEILIESGRSKILVYKENIDEIIGYIHSFELFKEPKNISSILRPVLIVHESQEADEIMKQLISERKSIAIVVDEFGGTSGILTLEDIIEEIFGDIEDEFDSEDLIEMKLSDTEYEFSARLEIDYLNDKYNLRLPESEDYETLGGLITSLHESIPNKNEIIRLDGLVFKIKDVSNSRIETIKLITE
jgi:putative hemolysin